MKEFLPTYRRKFKCSGKHGIKIKKGNRWNQKIFFVYSAEMNRLYPSSSHQQDPDPHHSKQQYNSVPKYLCIGTLRSKFKDTRRVGYFGTDFGLKFRAAMLPPNYGSK